MGFSLFAYLLLCISGFWLFSRRTTQQLYLPWLRPLHYLTGAFMVFMVLLLLIIGLVGTIGHYGSLGHSPHLIAGLLVVVLVLLSAWSSSQISTQGEWARSLHVSLNVSLFFAFVFVTLTGWEVVQKYLP